MFQNLILFHPVDLVLRSLKYKGQCNQSQHWKRVALEKHESFFNKISRRFKQLGNRGLRKRTHILVRIFKDEGCAVDSKEVCFLLVLTAFLIAVFTMQSSIFLQKDLYIDIIQCFDAFLFIAFRVQFSLTPQVHAVVHRATKQ